MNHSDFDGEFPHKNDILNPNAMTYKNGTFPYWGPWPWDEKGLLKDTPVIRYKNWKERATELGVVHLGHGGEEIVSGIQDISKGFSLILVPVPTEIEDIKGMAYIVYGVFELAGGITKSVIGLIRWEESFNENP